MIIIAGPCVIEKRDYMMKIAEDLIYLNENKNIHFYFKSSFDKANRTSNNSFRGPGIDKGLKLLEEIKKQFNFKLVTDIHESHQAKTVSDIVDVIQIPAFLCRQTDLLIAAAKTNLCINIKKGQFLSANAMEHPVGKVLNSRGFKQVDYNVSKENNVWLCERGNIFGYNSIVVDMKNLITMRKFAPVIFDATHSAQVPSSGSTTGGNSKIVPSLAKAAAAVGVDGFFFETHFDPNIALSDGPNMLSTKKLKSTIEDIFKIHNVLNYN